RARTDRGRARLENDIRRDVRSPAIADVVRHQDHHQGNEAGEEDCRPLLPEELDHGIARRPGICEFRAQSSDIFLSRLKSVRIFPVPRATEASGSSAMETGSPVSSRSRLSRFLRSEPPPVRTMPRSTM